MTAHLSNICLTGPYTPEPTLAEFIENWLPATEIGPESCIFAVCANTFLLFSIGGLWEEELQKQLFSDSCILDGTLNKAVY